MGWSFQHCHCYMVSSQCEGFTPTILHTRASSSRRQTFSRQIQYPIHFTTTFSAIILFLYSLPLFIIRLIYFIKVKGPVSPSGLLGCPFFDFTEVLGGEDNSSVLWRRAGIKAREGGFLTILLSAVYNAHTTLWAVVGEHNDIKKPLFLRVSLQEFLIHILYCLGETEKGHHSDCSPSCIQTKTCTQSSLVQFQHHTHMHMHTWAHVHTCMHTSLPGLESM